MEEKVANAILEKEIQIDINGKSYKVKPHSVATLIEVSRLIAKMPYINGNVDYFLQETLRTARECQILGDIVATLVLGVQRKTWFNKWLFRSAKEMKFKKISEEILQLTPSKLRELVSKLLSTLEITDFFGLTISLSEVNLLKPTKEVGKTTASGQQ